jgi:hypothetical protein
MVETSAQLRRLVDQFKINAQENTGDDDRASPQTRGRAARAGL